jgi:hypothetical protein
VETPGCGRQFRFDALPWLALMLLGPACATLNPRFDQAVTTSFARQPMRKLETARVELYYPESQREEALRVVTRLDRCVEQLRRLTHSGTERPKVLAYLTTANFDNAYVQPQVAGFPAQMVLAHHFTLEFFNLLEIGNNNVGDVSCHEAVHYVQFAEVEELWRYLNAAFGDLLDPNIFMESYFLEGLATYYEGRLERDTGRPHSPIWRGLFQSGLALRQGEIHSGDLSPGQRELLPFGGNYVVGMQFIEWLADRYGPDRLWELVDLQGRSWFSPFGVAFRFMWVYGKGPGELVDEWRSMLRHSGPWRSRPAGQKTLDGDLGYFARLASAPDGTLATITAGRDFPPELRIRNPDGSLRLRQSMMRFFPGRPTIATSPLSVSGLSFRADGERLYFMLADVGIDGDTAPKVVELDGRSGKLLRTWETPDSLGGAVTPDGTSYVFVRSHGDTGDLWSLELATGNQRPLTHHTGRLTLGAPAPAADGRIVFALKSGEDFDLWVRTPDGTERPLTRDGRFNYSPRWAGADQVVALHEVDGRTQAVRIEVSSGAMVVFTDAPFVVLDPVPLPGERLAFVNREGWGWTLDVVDLGPGQGRSEPPAVAAPEPAEPDVPVLRDGPYHALDNLLVPTLRGPFVSFDRRERFGTTQNTVYGGFSLEGSDRLGLHQYAFNLGYETSDPGPTFSFGYGNYQLAPVYLAGYVTRIAEPAARDVSDNSFIPSVVDIRAGLSATRTFWTTPVTLSFLAVHRKEGFSEGPRYADLLGPGLGTSWSAVESTPYAGSWRGVAVTASGQLFAKALGSDYTFGDVRSTVTGYLPLPFWARHTLQLTLRGRALVAAPPRLLRVGGSSVGFWEGRTQEDKSQPGTGLEIFPDVTFREPLRGYEDAQIRTNQVIIGGVRYRAPIVVDWGWSSFLWILPSVFVRQVDLEAFGEWAHTWTSPTVPGPALQSNHRTYGAALFLRTLWAQAVPLSFYYQVAIRPDDGLTPLHVFGIAYQ